MGSSDDIGRRAVLKGGIGLGIGLGIRSAGAFGQESAAASRPREGDLLVKDSDAGATPLTPDDIATEGTPTYAWAMDPVEKIVRKASRLNMILLVRLDGVRFTAETQARSAGNVVAYTAICTHSGCEVTDLLPDEQVLHCECHISSFDPNDGAKVVAGPAPRALPALPLRLEDGKLVVAAPFTARIGFESA